MDVFAVLYGTVLLLLCFFLAFFAYVTTIVALSHAKYDHLPGPKRTSFYLGNATELGTTTRQHDKDFADEGTKKLKPLRAFKFVEWHDLYGDTFVVFIIHRTLIWTRSTAALKNVLVSSDPKDFPKDVNHAGRYLFGERYMGDGLVTAVGHDAWYLRRKAIDPVFHRNQLRLSVDVFNATGDHFIEELHGYSESGQSFKFSPVLQRATLDVIMKVMFSIDSHNMQSDFHEIATEFVADTFNAMQMAFVIPLMKYNPYFYTFCKSIGKQLREFRQIGAKLISERKAAVTNGDAVPADFLTTMIQASMDPSTGYTFDVMLDEFVTIIIAGMETSASTLAFVFMELGRRPDLVHRLVHEVDEVVGKKAFISNDDISKLSFTTMLIKESLRLYPPAVAFSRDVKNELVLDGLRIPANSNLLGNILGANRNEKYLEDANKFIPDRFDSKQERRVPVYSFIPFSLGARNCVGQVFAQMEMKVMIAKFFQHFELVLDETETFEITEAGTLHPYSLLQCTVRARH